MFSIIVCSIHPDLASSLERNIASTIGVPFEFIAIDNRGSKKGICAVYNEGAQRAKYDYLCFAHEDILFHTSNWGNLIATKLAEQDCGVIGFAGGISKFPLPYGWCSIPKHICENIIQGYGGKRPAIKMQLNCKGDFSKVVTLDGLCHFVRRDVWERCRYDEVTFPLFHSYDTDFSTSVFINGYVNYVCNNVLVEHFSYGNFDHIWFESEKAYLKKWGKHLPLFADKEISAKYKHDIKRIETKMLRRLYKTGLITETEAFTMWKNFISKHPLHLSAYFIPIRMLKYKRRLKNKTKHLKTHK